MKSIAENIENVNFNLETTTGTGEILQDFPPLLEKKDHGKYINRRICD